MFRQDRTRTGRGVVGILDIGTSKVCCLIATEPEGAIAAGWRLAGFGYQRSRGLKAGVIVDLDEVERAIRAAVSQAERAAGLTLEEIWVTLTAGRLRSQSFAANADVRGEVRPADVERVLHGARAYAEREGRVLVHLNPLGFRVDAMAGVRVPVGMAGQRLTLDAHTVTADDAPLRNVLLAVERAHLALAGFVVAPFASALAVTTPEERHLGVTCIDIGAGTIGIAVFLDGVVRHLEAIPVGGQHLTFDIARNLSTPLAEAERIKTLYGTLTAAASDQRESFTYSMVGEGEPQLQQATKADVRRVITARMQGLLDLIGERLAAGPQVPQSAARLVLTGGTSGLVGVAEFAAAQLGRPVRVGRPVPLAGMPGSVSSPAFSAVIGALAAVAGGEGLVRAGGERRALGGGMLGRVGDWFRESF